MTGKQDGKIFSMQWINVRSHKTETEIEVICLHTRFYISDLFDAAKTESGVTEGFGFISKPLKRVIILADLNRICFPKRKWLQPPLHLGHELDLSSQTTKSLIYL